MYTDYYLVHICIFYAIPVTSNNLISLNSTSSFGTVSNHLSLSSPSNPLLTHLLPSACFYGGSSELLLVEYISNILAFPTFQLSHGNGFYDMDEWKVNFVNVWRGEWLDQQN